MIFNNKEILKTLKECAWLKPNQEVCGIIIKKKCGKLKFQECDNLSDDRSTSFLIDPNYFIKYDIQYIFHSHCAGSATPSCFDIQCSDDLGIDFLIYSLRDDEFNLYENKCV
jgi:proteasome lid subunit RPN8/RPN11